MEEEKVAKDLNAKFKFETRSHGVERALDGVHQFNADAKAKEDRTRQNDMEGMASNRMMVGFKGGFGYRPATNAGKRWVLKITTRNGVQGSLEQNFLDGELLNETFTPHT